MVCGGSELTLTRSPESTLQELLDALGANTSLQLSRPSISSANGVVFIQKPAVLRQQHEYKLTQSLRELIAAQVFAEGEELTVTDAALPSKLKLRVNLS